MASNFFEVEVSSPKEALYIKEDRLSETQDSAEKLWQAADISSNEKFLTAPTGGSGKGPEEYKGPDDTTDLKLPVFFRDTITWGDGRGRVEDLGIFVPY